MNNNYQHNYKEPTDWAGALLLAYCVFAMVFVFGLALLG